MPGDNLLADFVSVFDALNCAVEMRRTAGEINEPAPADRRLELRVGINLGDVNVDDDIFGDGVNVAARFEALAQPGTVCVSVDAGEVLNKCAPTKEVAQLECALLWC